MKLRDDTARLMEIASRGSATVLITGPTGSGKTYLARRIHDAGPRRLKPFVTVNLATLHEGTFESELFGHERGSFTGADSRRTGRLEMAQGGTVFLDEVGELSPRFQARLLEFLQSRVISPVGSNREIRLDARVIAATNKNLATAVSRKEFREDLFHRLRVISLDLKPLCERFEEFDGLVHAALSEICSTNQRSILKISEEVADRLERHDWPGNLRELRNVLEYAVLSAENDEIHLSDLPSWFVEQSMDQLQCADSHIGEFNLGRQFAAYDYATATSHFEREYLGFALRKNLGRINRTARQIGLNKSTLLRRMKAYGLDAQECASVFL